MKKAEAILTTKIQNPTRKIIRTIKFHMPRGATFKEEDAKFIIGSWKKEARSIEEKRSDFVAVSQSFERRMASLTKEIEDAAGDVRKAKTYYKTSKDPVKKRVWARRLVLASELHKYVRESHSLMNGTVERVKDAIEDGKLVSRLMHHRISDAEAYFKLNGQLKLMGKDLAAARQNYMAPEIEVKNVEYNLEQIEKGINDKLDDQILIEAEAILKEPTIRTQEIQ